MASHSQETSFIHKTHKYVPKSPTPEAHTLETWTPPTPPSAISPKYWIIYIHGGAWWRPMIDSSSFALTAHSILSSGTSHVAGLASLNYRLSTPPPLPQFSAFVEPENPGRNVKHPAHLHDVETAIAFLQNQYGFGENYVVVGHSCGATLAFQLQLGERLGVGPKGVIGVEGIYDMRRLVDDHAQVSMYRLFTESAFGSDKEEWDRASPAVLEGKMKGMFAWEKASVVAIAQSAEDELVDRGQAEIMRKLVAMNENEQRKSEEIELIGKHDEVWSLVREGEKGTQVGKAIERVLELLFEDERLV